MSATILESDVLLAMRGDESAYHRLIEQSANTVCSIALAIVRNVEASEDVAQEVFLVVWTNLRKLRNPASFLPWLRQVTRNQAHLWLREHRREVLACDEALAAAIDPRPTPVDSLLQQEERRVLADVLDALPEDAREVVILYYREQSSAKHVAELLGISEAAVKQRLSRARARIREEVLQRFGSAVASAAPPITKFVMPALAKASLAGAALGIAGILLGMKKLEPVFDEQEGAELRTLRNHAAIVMVIASVVFALIGRTAPPRWWAVPVFVAFFGALWHLYGVRLPRILQRRYESEAQPQPRRAWMYETIGHAAGATLTGTTFMLILMRHC